MDLELGKLVISRGGDAKPTAYKILPATRIWKGRALGTLADLAASQSILIDLTFATAQGPWPLHGHLAGRGES